MTLFEPQLAEIRFGCGLAPHIAPPGGIEAMLAGLTGPDTAVASFPIEPFDVFRQRMIKAQGFARLRRKARGTSAEKIHHRKLRQVKTDARKAQRVWLGQNVLRRAHTVSGFRERLVYFWADHFTAFGKTGVMLRATSPYIEDAIRPNFTGRFADLLIACVSHPVMLDYLDQQISVGPNSSRAQRNQGKSGLNENLAREVLELHSIGVDGPYDQEDVRELAELFTGMTHNPKQGFQFRKGFAEPGRETVLGVTYGDTANFEPIRAVLEDLSIHPSTARHIAQKLAVHFVSDTPDPDLVAHLEQRFLATGGDLMQVYAALLEHPAAWVADLRNAKLPIDFVGSACRALAIPRDRLEKASEKQLGRGFFSPMVKMGQSWQFPDGPDGWSEDDGDWITPQGLTARIQWAMQIPQYLVPDLPDPRDFVQAALGSYASDTIRFAASAAESKSEAIGLVLASPAFQQR